MLRRWRAEIWTFLTRFIRGRDQTIPLVARCMLSFNKNRSGPHGPIISFAGCTGMRVKVGFKDEAGSFFLENISGIDSDCDHFPPHSFCRAML